MLRILCVSMVLVCVAASSALAQVCAGGAAFSGAPLQVGGGVGFTERAQVNGASFGGGTDTGFGLLSVGGLTVDGVNDTALSVGATMGADPVVGGNGRVRVCPLGTLTYLRGPDTGDLHSATLDLKIGGRLGVVAAQSTNVQLIPTVGLSFVYTRLMLRPPEPLNNLTEADTYGVASLGAGLVFNRRIAITPLVSLPLFLGEETPEFSLGLSVNFGH